MAMWSFPVLQMPLRHLRSSTTRNWMVVTWCLIMLPSKVVGEVALVGIGEGEVEVAHKVKAAVAEAEEVCEILVLKIFTQHFLIRWLWRRSEVWHSLKLK